MTIVAHGLWAITIYKPIKKTNWKLAVFWSIFPDLIWGIPFIPYLLIFQQPIPADFSNAVWWLYHLYGLSHSLIIAGISIAGATLVLKKITREMLTWPLLHILLDIPGHTSFKTPFLYPISDFTIPGPFSWNDQPYMLLSHVLPLLLIFYQYFHNKKS